MIEENTNEFERKLMRSEESNQPLITSNKNLENVPTFTFPEKAVSNLSSSTKHSFDQLKTNECMNARTVLWWLVFVGFAVNCMMVMNLNITIVAMVSQKKLATSQKMSLSKNTTLVNTPACFYNDEEVLNSNNYTHLDVELVSNWNKFSLERQFLKSLNLNQHIDGFEWDEKQQGLVLGSFFWLHWVTQIPGGILARKYGTKLVFGLSNLIGCLLCSVMPIVSFFDYRILIFFRVLQGLICGVAWPAMHDMTAQWIPPNERSKFVTAYLGSSVGIAIFYPLFGAVISLTSWEWVFHLCSIFGAIWYVAWLYCVFDSPQNHPRIDPEEREYILKSLAGTFQNRKKHSTPWKEILTSCPVWMNIISQFGGIWGLFTLMTQAPTYFNTIHGWDIKVIGLLTGITYLFRMVFSYFFSLFGDYLLRTDKMSTTNVRNLATFVSSILKGIFIIGISYSGCNGTMAMVFLTIATVLNGASSAGSLASIVDMSPNFSGVVLGFCGMVSVMPGFISPYVVGYLTFGNQTVEQWKYVYLISAGMLIGTGILFVLFSDSTEQHWNNIEDHEDEEEKEQQINNDYSMVPCDDVAHNENCKLKRENA